MMLVVWECWNNDGLLKGEGLSGLRISIVSSWKIECGWLTVGLWK
jgi:hypothetical protein